MNDAIRNVRTLAGEAGRKGFFHLFGANFLSQIIGFAAQVFLAGILSPIDIGRIKILQTYVGTAVLVGKAGLDSSVLKLNSEERPEDQKRPLFTAGLLGVGVTGMLTLLVLWAVNGAGALTSDAGLQPLFWLYLVLIPLQSLFETMVAHLQGLQKFRQASTVQIVLRSLNLVLIVVGTIIGGVQGFVAGVVFGALFALLWLGWTMRSDLVRLTLSQTRALLGSHWPFARYSLAANSTHQVLLYLEVFFVNYLVQDRTEIGFYGFALTLLVPFVTVTGTLQQWMMPALSKASSNRHSWWRLYRRYQILTLGGSVVLAAGAAAVVPWLLTFVFDGRYADSGYYFLLLLVGWVIRMAYIPMGLALWGLGEIRLNFYSVLIALPFSVTITLFLVRSAGVPGAGLAHIASQVMLAIIVTALFLFIVARDRTRHTGERAPSDPQPPQQ